MNSKMYTVKNCFAIAKNCKEIKLTKGCGIFRVLFMASWACHQEFLALELVVIT